ncbi:DUF3025 domain-containing protein [Psychrobacter sp. NG25]|uniref:DUF3025 domain-containing protein n=1 Tax=Psychrobacter sp. NG25 TaxID=2782005 RepID=UPI0018838FB8|nr:DUF3025 domain-containing protein [Psychrobacter sp. NG25]MBF0659307.1 DUF3025 domain-containing protein [Psychrobacter sp. NG25]
MLTTDSPVTLDADVSSEISSMLDKNFADINWQAPWMCHINQLNIISATIQSLSSSSEQNNAMAYEGQPIDVIAGVLNNAFNQQSSYGQSSHEQAELPTTKPTHNNQAHTLKFVSQDALPEGEAYESFIATTGNIPTRDNLHDLFNGSIWLTFPKTKALLNYYHMLEIAAQGINASRGRVRDTITVFDENGAVLVTADPNIGEALIGFDWQASLVTPRPKWDEPQQPTSHAQAAVYIFGHALLEQLIKPRKPLCAHSIVINVAQDFFALSLSERMNCLDEKVAEYMDTLLSKDDVTPRQLAPLPILGVPHFWPDNTDPSFYDDDYVFRSGRRHESN